MAGKSTEQADDTGKTELHLRDKQFEQPVRELLSTIYTVKAWSRELTAPRVDSDKRLLEDLRKKGLYPYDRDNMPVEVAVGKLCVREPYTRATLAVDEALVDHVIQGIVDHALHWQYLCQVHYNAPLEFRTLEPRREGESRRRFLIRAQAWCQDYLRKIAEAPEEEPRPMAGKTTATDKANPPAPNTNVSKEATALAILTDHPEWTNKQIAEAVGVHPKTLSSHRYAKFKEARLLLRESGRAGLPRGNKHTDGSVEAY